MRKLSKGKKNSKKIIKRLDERLVDFLFGPHQGYVWGKRCETDAGFKKLLLEHTGFVDVRLESRLLYDEIVPFTVFQTAHSEFAFNQVCWHEGGLKQKFLRNGDLFLFRNQQRIISVAVSHPSHILSDHACLHDYRISDSETHWTQQNIWLNDYLDFIKRIESLLAHPAMQASIQPVTQHDAAYQAGYRLAQWLRKLLS